MPSSLGDFTVDGSGPVVIGSVEGDVYVMQGAISTPRPTPTRGGAGGLVRISPEQSKLNFSTDSLLTWLNYYNQDSRLSALTGMAKEYLVGAQMGIMAGQLALNDKLFDIRADQMLSEISRYKPIQKTIPTYESQYYGRVPVTMPPPTRVTVNFVSDTSTPEVLAQKFLDTHGLALGEMAGLFVPQEQTPGSVTLIAFSNDTVKKINSLVESSDSDPNFGGIATASYAPDPVDSASYQQALDQNFPPGAPVASPDQMLSDTVESGWIPGVQSPGTAGGPCGGMLGFGCDIGLTCEFQGANDAPGICLPMAEPYQMGSPSYQLPGEGMGGGGSSGGGGGMGGGGGIGGGGGMGGGSSGGGGGGVGGEGNIVGIPTGEGPEGGH